MSGIVSSADIASPAFYRPSRPPVGLSMVSEQEESRPEPLSYLDSALDVARTARGRQVAQLTLKGVIFGGALLIDGTKLFVQTNPVVHLGMTALSTVAMVRSGILVYSGLAAATKAGSPSQTNVQRVQRAFSIACTALMAVAFLATITKLNLGQLAPFLTVGVAATWAISTTLYVYNAYKEKRSNLELTSSSLDWLYMAASILTPSYGVVVSAAGLASSIGGLSLFSAKEEAVATPPPPSKLGIDISLFSGIPIVGNHLIIPRAKTNVTGAA